jgi:hypothetical protein
VDGGRAQPFGLPAYVLEDPPQRRRSWRAVPGRSGPLPCRDPVSCVQSDHRSSFLRLGSASDLTRQRSWRRMACAASATVRFWRRSFPGDRVLVPRLALPAASRVAIQSAAIASRMTSSATSRFVLQPREGT